MPYNPSDHKAINQPFGMGAIPLNSKSLFYDTNLLKYRYFQNVAEVNTYFANLTFRDPTFDVIVNTGGVLAAGVITGGVNDVYWFRDGVNLVLKETDLSNYYDEQQIDAFLAAINQSISDLRDDVEAHVADTSNPHEVTKDQVGLGNVDNTSDLDKPVSEAQQEVLDLKASLDYVTEQNEILQDQITLLLGNQTQLFYENKRLTYDGTNNTINLDFTPKGIGPVFFENQSALTPGDGFFFTGNTITIKPSLLTIGIEYLIIIFYNK